MYSFLLIGSFIRQNGFLFFSLAVMESSLRPSDVIRRRQSSLDQEQRRLVASNGRDDIYSLKKSSFFSYHPLSMEWEGIQRPHEEKQMSKHKNIFFSLLCQFLPPAHCTFCCCFVHNSLKKMLSKVPSSLVNNKSFIVTCATST